MPSSRLPEAAVLEIGKHLPLRDLLEMRKLSHRIKLIVERSIRDQGLAPIEVIMHQYKDVFVVANEPIGSVETRTIREKEQLEEEDYMPAPFTTIDVFIAGLEFNPSNERMADVVKVLGLRSARKVAKFALKFSRAQLSPEHLAVLNLLRSKPLESLVLEWRPEDAGYNEDLQSDLEALDSLFQGLRGTLEEVNIKGPFNATELVRWLNTEKMREVHFQPLHNDRLALDYPEIPLDSLISVSFAVKNCLQGNPFPVPQGESSSMFLRVPLERAEGLDGHRIVPDRQRTLVTSNEDHPFPHCDLLPSSYEIPSRLKNVPFC
ncbi:hypothetical protein L596_000505 [Steinernema carpocapsae]|uniref:F-box domain-containing protein n=1 Tax=Steinernema carpocapsae TaxID=34508 RepID=A0A4U8UKP0_STECR|nr:hypothetical protein L596_000505 [Steinernema carpocapsae]